MIYRLLGDLAVGSFGRRLPLREKYRRVLAALMLNANHTVTKRDLLRAGWGAAQTQEAQLHKAINAIREVLRNAGRDDDLNTRAGVGYELRVTDGDLDMLRFIRLVGEADVLSTDQPAKQIELLREALALWSGPRPLSNLDRDGFDDEIVALDKRRRRAAVRLFTLILAQSDIAAELEQLDVMATYYPTDRQLCELFMLAAYGGGQPNEALTALSRHEQALLDDNYSNPDPKTRKLAYAIAQSNAAAVQDHQTRLIELAGVGTQRARRVPRELPDASYELIGRQDPVHETHWLLTRPDATSRVVVISGPAGMGKTALGVHVGHLVRDHFTDGDLYAELHDARGRAVPAGEVLGQFLRSLGEAHVPESTAERAKAYRTLLADRRMLVLLDDAHDEAQIRDLLPGNTQCGVLVTARRRLPGLTGAHSAPPLEPLELPAAVALFETTLRRAGVTSRNDAEATERAVALCGGLPLAICIAGALRVLDLGRPMDDFARRLNDQGVDGFSYGERSVARTIGASFDQLDEGARELLLALGRSQLVTFGHWTAAAVGGVDPGGALSQLVAGYIAMPADGDHRYRLHDLTRSYAGRRARERGGDQSALTRIYGALLTLVRRAHHNLYQGDFEIVHGTTPDWEAPPATIAKVDRSGIEWFATERRNIRSAVEHCAELGLTELCWDLAASSHEFYTLGGYFDDWYATHKVALDACRRDGDVRGEGVMLAILGQPALIASCPAGEVSGPDQLQRAAELLAACGEWHGYAIAVRTWANALRRRGQLALPLRLFQDALQHYQASGDRLGSCMTLRYIGQTHLDMGDHKAALATLDDALEAAVALDNPRMLAQTEYWIGQAFLAAGDLAKAQARFETVTGWLGDVEGLGHAYAFHGYADVARLLGNQADARQWCLRAAQLAEASSDTVLEGRIQLSLAALERDVGDIEPEIAALERAAGCFAGGGATYHETAALAALARAEATRQRADAAHSAWERVRRLYTEMDLPEVDRIHHPPAS